MSAAAKERVRRANLSLALFLLPRALPRTTAECRAEPGPCAYVTCSHHLKYDIDPETGVLTDNFPDVELEDMADTCALEVADRGPQTFKALGEIMGVGLARADQMVTDALWELAAKLELPTEAGIDEVRAALCVVSVENRWSIQQEKARKEDCDG